MSNAELVCWNCLKRTPPGECKHCGAELSNPDEAFEEKESTFEPRLFEISREGEDSIVLDETQLLEIVERYFEVVRVPYIHKEPTFIVKDSEEVREDKFTKLLEDTDNLSKGLQATLTPVDGSNNIIITFIYRVPPSPVDFRTVILLMIFTIISVIFAGLFSGSQLQSALNNADVNNSNILSMIFNLDTLIYGITFSVVLLLLIVVKDGIQLKYYYGKDKQTLTLFYIPAPPIFELGTFGSIFHQDRHHLNKNDMFKRTFIGPVISWLLSVIVIFISLPLSSYNPGSAELYSNHSITTNGEFEPFIISILTRIANSVGLTSFDLSEPFTSLYILHPITAGALGAFYIISFSLLPATNLNGGFIVRSIFGKQAHRFFTYLVIGSLFFVNFIIPIFIFFFYELFKTPEVLDDVTPVDQNLRKLMIPFFIILLLSFPLNYSIITQIF